MELKELRTWTIQAAKQWRHKCRGLPLLLQLIDLIERMMLRVINFLDDLRRASYPSRYDHLVSDKEFVGSPP